MENHPIPQDVTGFKFKLIGSVTVKQFLYILGGGILAAISIILPFSGIIKYPLAAIFGGIGAAMAFVPIEGRPMDVMIKNFLKALPSENEYIYKKVGALALITEFFTTPPVVRTQVVQQTTESEQDSKRELLYKTLRISSSYKPDAKEQEVLTNINSYFNETQHSATPQIQKVDAIPKEIPKPLQIVHPVEPPRETPVTKPAPAPVAAEVPPPPPPPPPPPIPVKPPINATEGKSIAPEKQLKGGFPSLPDTPNIVMGIVKDPRGKVIPNILVEIMDAQQNPVRAFKTNALGQFAAATPLANGEYNVTLEDPKKLNEFGPIHLVLDGKIFEPLEIVSIDQREKLRRELFGNQTVQQNG